ncbi:MAG: FAD-binding oxidoreductase [Bermanella sp.]
MKAWNGWGDEKNNFDFALSEGSRNFIEARIGKGEALGIATLEDTVKKVPATRAPAHPLIDTDAETRLRHCRGQSIPDWLAMRSGDFGVFPDGVAFPETTKQVKEILAFAKEKDLIVIPYGGGTSVCGHINPEKGDKPVITVSLGRMNKLMALDKESQIATFGAGTLGPEIEEQLSKEGYTLGHYPQSWELSSIGGWVASRSSGQQSLRYGRIEKMFAGGHIETLQGPLEILTFPASSAGPDVRELFMGSEGRMGIITEVKVRVMPIAEKESFYVAFFPSWEIGMRATREIVQNGIQLSMMRLSNAVETQTHLKLAGHEKMVGALETYLKFRGVNDGKVMFTFGTTGSKAQCKSALKLARKHTSKHGGVFTGSAMGKRWEHARFRSPYLRHGLWDIGVIVDTMETCLDWSSVNAGLADMESSIKTSLAEFNEEVHVFTHLSHFYGQGCSVYTTFLFRNGKNYDDTMARWEKLKAAGAEAIVRHGGTISHQHGVGKDHAKYLPAEKGELGIRAISELCNMFDPDSRMNPGKLVP